MQPICKAVRAARHAAAVAGVLGALALSGPASAQVKLTDNLSVTGFIDMSAGLVNGTTEDSPVDKVTTYFAGFDQFETDFLYSYGSVSAQADINALGDGPVTLEQAFVSYKLESGLGITAGKFLSSLGFEAAEPTGLYQYSWSEGIPYPGYQHGVALTYSPVEKVGLYLAGLTGVWDSADRDPKNPGVEAQVSLTPIEGLTAKVGIGADQLKNDAGDSYFKSELNAWASYKKGNLLVAGEVDLLSNWTGEDDSGMHFLGMANYAMDKLALTVRFSGIDLDSAGDMSTEITVSPSYKISDNWLGILEFKQLLDKEVTNIVVETLFTF